MTRSAADMRRALALIEAGTPSATFEGTWRLPSGDEVRFSASANLYVIREAWDEGVSFEAEADGFGAGEGTHGDWSAIRDSSADATAAMLAKALRHFGVGVGPEMVKVALPCGDGGNEWVWARVTGLRRGIIDNIPWFSRAASYRDEVRFDGERKFVRVLRRDPMGTLLVLFPTTRTREEQDALVGALLGIACEVERADAWIVSVMFPHGLLRAVRAKLAEFGAMVTVLRESVKRKGEGR